MEFYENGYYVVSQGGGVLDQFFFFFFIKVAFKAENRRQLWSEILLSSFPLHIILLMFSVQSTPPHSLLEIRKKF